VRSVRGDPTATTREAWVEAAYQEWDRANPEGHGSLAKYQSGCRCERCHEAGNARHRRSAARIRAALTAGTIERPHNLTRYAKGGCRCDTCRAAGREYYREYRARKRRVRAASGADPTPTVPEEGGVGPWGEPTPVRARGPGRGVP